MASIRSRRIKAWLICGVLVGGILFLVVLYGSNPFEDTPRNDETHNQSKLLNYESFSDKAGIEHARVLESLSVKIQENEQADESSTEVCSLALLRANLKDSSEGISITHMRSESPLKQTAQDLLEEAKEQKLKPVLSGYLDLQGNVWCVLFSRGSVSEFLIVKEDVGTAGSKVALVKISKEVQHELDFH